MTMKEKLKRARLERIKRVAEHRKGNTMTCWISRNCDEDGITANYVDVWLVRPVRKEGPGRAVTYCLPGENPQAEVEAADGPVRAHLGRWTLEACQKQFNTVPDDSRQVIKSGNDESPPLIESWW